MLEHIGLYTHTRLLQKSHLKKNNAISIRDSLRNEVSKQCGIADENKEKREQKVVYICVPGSCMNVICKDRRAHI